MPRPVRTLLILTLGAALLGPLLLGSSHHRHRHSHRATASKPTRAKQQERQVDHPVTRTHLAIEQGKDVQAIPEGLPQRPAMKHRAPRYDLSDGRARVLTSKRSYLRAQATDGGLFQACPVRGYHEVTNSFGVTVRIPGVPVHIHQGDDILSSYGTPIVAPFAGNAVASWSAIGGMAVKVYGDRGFVYNAHLERYGALGHVRVGTVIGYVGATGDARSPHDHFEWHPGNGSAVDPYPYLSVVC